MTAKKLFFLSARLMKNSGAITTHSLMSGYRFSVDEDVATGSFIKAVMKEKPNFDISQITCGEITREEICEHLGLMEGT